MIALQNKIIELWLNTETKLEKIRKTTLAVERAAYALFDEVLSTNDISITNRCLTLSNIVSLERIVYLYPIAQLIKGTYDRKYFCGLSTLHYITIKDNIPFEVCLFPSKIKE